MDELVITVVLNALFEKAVLRVELVTSLLLLSPHECETAPSPPPHCWRWEAVPGARLQPRAAMSTPTNVN